VNSRIKPSDATDASKGSVDLGGGVEVYPSHAGALARMAYIQNIGKSIPALSEYDYVNGSALLRVSSVLRPTQAKALPGGPAQSYVSMERAERHWRVVAHARLIESPTPDGWCRPRPLSSCGGANGFSNPQRVIDPRKPPGGPISPILGQTCRSGACEGCRRGDLNRCSGLFPAAA
jgi:hypothetical protein